ncbi:Mpo1-like protein [Mesorhizobium huakuii]|uniref:Mpo1-like protein n=2 Tax=Mesorhizobium huakuii TaxID=28104 RepID=A0ABZ0VPU6_9HYPH|nr:Mpo1-like protein [Mesorhizobium huakuii]WQB99426.1 Mpo1-like protein [Mesorhizobium huakuii]
MNPQTFDEYWLGYLAGHSKPSTRFIHYIGLFFAPLAGIAASFLVVW